MAIRFDRNKPLQIFLTAGECIVACVIFVDSVITATSSNVSEGVQNRFGIPARPILLMLWSSRIREIISEVWGACRSLKYMALLILAWLLLSSLLFVQTLRRMCNNGDGNREYLFPQSGVKECTLLMRHFDNSLVGFVSVFILITGEMYTVLTLPLFDIPGHAFDFLIVLLWSIISYFILMAIVLAIIFSAYKDAKHSTFVVQSDALDESLMDAFELITSRQNFVVRFAVYARFLECFQVDSPSAFNCMFFAH